MVGNQNNATLKIVRPRLVAKNSANNNSPTIQNLGEKILSTNKPASAAIPVARDRLKYGQAKTNSAMNIAAIPLRMPLT